MILTVENLTFSYAERDMVLQNVSFSLSTGELTALLGGNGAGKTTLFRCILGSLTKYSGRVVLDGRDCRTIPQREMARHIAYIPQTHRPTFGYSVLDTVLMGTARQMGTLQQPGKKQEEIAFAAMERLRITHLARRNFAHLSGGEQQLVLIARAIAQQAELLILDEPTASLDYGHRLHLLEQVRSLSAEGYGILMSTHDPQHALTYADRLLALHGGTLAADGRPDEVLTPVLMERLYGVRVTQLTTEAGTILVPIK